MIRVLLMVAAAGFLVAVVTLSAAVAITGPEAIARGAWSFGPNSWSWRRSHQTDREGGAGPETTKTVAFEGSDLELDLPADVAYVQKAGPGSLVITGPRAEVEDVKIVDGKIQYGEDEDHDGRLTLVVSSPKVTHFRMDGSGSLTIKGYRQDTLALDLEGDSTVKAEGEAKGVTLSIAGSSNVDLGGVKARSASVQISGSGDAVLAPREAADVDISGSGDVTLLTRPPKLQTSISGSGRVNQADADPNSGRSDAS